MLLIFGDHLDKIGFYTKFEWCLVNVSLAVAFEILNETSQKLVSIV